MMLVILDLKLSTSIWTLTKLALPRCQLPSKRQLYGTSFVFFDCETSYRCVFVRSIPISSTRPEDELVKPNNSPDPHPPKSSCRAQL